MAEVQQLSVERVESVFADCLFRDGEDASNCVKTEGVTVDVLFNRERLKSHETDIVGMVSELPEEFRELSGGGSSMLCASFNKHGRPWAHSRRTLELLFQLCVAAGKARSAHPRSVWSALPGEVPYYTVLG